MALGSEAHAQGFHAMAFGWKAETNGMETIAIGQEATSTAGQGIAIGAKSKAQGSQSIALGANTNAKGVASIAIGGDDVGYSGLTEGDLVDAYAAVKSARDKLDAAKVKYEETVWDNIRDGKGLNTSSYGDTTQAGGRISTAVGIKANSEGDLSNAIGFVAYSEGESSMAFGTAAHTGARAEHATAIGTAAHAQGRRSNAIGLGAVTGEDAHDSSAIGTGATANVADGVALGSRSVANRTPTSVSGLSGFDVSTGQAYTGEGANTATWRSTLGAVSVGGSSDEAISKGGGATQTRQITGLAAGTADTDAVNVAQLRRVGEKTRISPTTTDGNSSGIALAPEGKVTYEVEPDGTIVFYNVNPDGSKGAKITPTDEQVIDANKPVSAADVVNTVNNTYWNAVGDKTEGVTDGKSVPIKAGYNVIFQSTDDSIGITQKTNEDGSKGTTFDFKGLKVDENSGIGPDGDKTYTTLIGPNKDASGNDITYNIGGWQIKDPTGGDKNIIVKGGGVVNFADGTGTTVSVTNTSGTPTIAYNVNRADTPAGGYSTNGTISAPTTYNNGTPISAESPAYWDAQQTADAINSAYWNIGTGTTAATNDAQIHAGDRVGLVDSSTVEVTNLGDGNFTFKVKTPPDPGQAAGYKFQGDNLSQIIEPDSTTATIHIQGGASTADGDLTDNNIGVVANPETNTLDIKLAKDIDLKDGSLTIGDTTTGGTKIEGDTITFTGDGGTISNVTSHLADASTATTTPTGNTLNALDGVKNQAATVEDVTRAGWNLQYQNSTGAAKPVDHVVHDDTVIFKSNSEHLTIGSVGGAGTSSTITFDLDLEGAVNDYAGWNIGDGSYTDDGSGGYTYNGANVPVANGKRVNFVDGQGTTANISSRTPIYGSDGKIVGYDNTTPSVSYDVNIGTFTDPESGLFKDGDGTSYTVTETPIQNQDGTTTIVKQGQFNVNEGNVKVNAPSRPGATGTIDAKTATGGDIPDGAKYYATVDNVAQALGDAAQVYTGDNYRNTNFSHQKQSPVTYAESTVVVEPQAGGTLPIRGWSAEYEAPPNGFSYSARNLQVLPRPNNGDLVVQMSNNPTFTNQDGQTTVAVSGNDGRINVGKGAGEGGGVQVGYQPGGGANPAEGNYVTGLDNKKWETGNIQSGRAATEDQLQQVAQSLDLSFSGDRNIWVGRDGNHVSIRLNPNVHVDSVTVNNGVYVVDGPSMTKQGINAAGTTITNVAPGIQETDAVNVGQLRRLEHKVNKMGDRADAGIAGAMAAAAVPQVTVPGANLLGAGAGYFHDQSAVAVGYSAMSDNGKWILKANASVSTEEAAASAGVGYQW